MEQVQLQYFQKSNKVTQTGMIEVPQPPVLDNCAPVYANVTFDDNASVTKEQNKLKTQIEMWLQSGADKPYECGNCSKRFSQKSHLNSHMLIHTSDKKYECELCGKRFTMESHLNGHMLVHTSEKKFECDVCAKRFAQKSHLNGHMLVHSEKKYG